jgi:hypothetical protein
VTCEHTTQNHSAWIEMSVVTSAGMSSSLHFSTWKAQGDFILPNTGARKQGVSR